MSTPIKIRVPLRDIAIDADNNCAWLTFPDGDAFLQTIMAARANPEKAAILPEPEKEPEKEAVTWHRAHGGCATCHRILDVRNLGLGGADELLCDGRCDEGQEEGQ